MKTLVTNYAFNATAKTVTFNTFTSIELEKVLLITNVTDNIIVYNFSDATKGGTVAGNVLTLTYDTTTMSNTDKLQIWYDNTAVTPATDDAVDAIYYLAKQLEWLTQAKVGNSGNQGIQPQLGVRLDTLSNLSTVSLVTILDQLAKTGIATGNAGATNRGSVDASFITNFTANTSAALSTINNVIVS